MNEAWIPKVAVLGAGAMGSMFGGLLGEGGLEVTLIDIWAEHVAAVQQSGLRLIGDSAERSVPVKATTRPAEAGEADVVLVHCKSHHTVQAVEAARSLFGADTVAISFQNGLGNEEMIGGVIGIERVLGGTTAQGASMVGPGAVRYYGDLPSQIGELTGGTSERAERIARALTAAGLQTSASAEIRRDIWKKLLANVALSAPSALSDLSIAELMAVPELKATSLAALEEAAAVARATGIELDAADTERVLAKITGAGGTSANKSSMCADVLKRRKTEIEVINGAVARLGREHGVPTPVNDTLIAAIIGVETHFV
jgi:2-dehydropantoate 2-reductase